MPKVLVVDDSSFARLSIIKHLSKDPEIEILDSAKDGIEAIEKARKLKPDVITMDVQMPKMDGLKALERIMSEQPVPVVMLSSLTGEGTDATIRALEIGAIDFYLKPSPTTPISNLESNGSLTEKIKLAASSGPQILKRRITARSLGVTPIKKEKQGMKRRLSAQSKIVVIGSSTGGPGALFEVIPKIPDSIPAGILLVQHMPAVFTKTLASRLNRNSLIHVKEAEPGDVIYEGHAYMAPGNYHMTVLNGNRINTNQQPAVRGLRPSVDVTMKSVSSVYGASVIGVVLTGMGNDGTEGARWIRRAGGKMAAQDEETSVIYGMPRSVIEAGLADKTIPLNNIADEIVSMCTE